MTAQAGEEEVLDQELDTSESDVGTDSQNDTDSEDDTESERKNTSNWKKMSEAKKQVDRELREERSEKAELKAELEKLKTWANSLYTDDQEKPFTKKEEKATEDKTERLEKKIFLIDNKDAKEYLDDIDSVRAKYNMDFDDAWAFVKAKLPAESKTKREFDTSSKAAPAKKDLSKVTLEESTELSPEERKKWRSLNGY